MLPNRRIILIELSAGTVGINIRESGLKSFPLISSPHYTKSNIQTTPQKKYNQLCLISDKTKMVDKLKLG